jgi:cyclic pyranopterin phosphate synthase
MAKLTHVDAEGRARMVDVSQKPATDREAIAEGLVRMSAQAKALALSADAKKGDVRAAAEIAGIMAAKRTADLIPLCHPIPLTQIEVEIAPDEHGLRVTAHARAHGPTGVEMEALTAVTIACLTIYDMLKAADRGMTIESVRLLKKSGGASGDYVREA